MNDFDDFLGDSSVFYGTRAGSKKALFREIARRASAVAGIAPEIVERKLLEREKLGSTGFGDGIAIPHGKLDEIERPFGLFFRLAEPVDYDSVDDLPVDCVFALFSPSDNGVVHLQALAKISRRLRDRKFVAKLRGARSEDALYALLTDYEAADAA